MKALVFVIIAMTISYTGVSFGQSDCTIDENDADTPGTATWNRLKYHLITRLDNDYKHWHKRKAKYLINEGSAPQAAPGAITASDQTWDQADWQGGDASDFTFICEGDTQRHADKQDGKNVISFKAYRASGSHNSVARTYLRQTHWGRRDRLKEVDTILNKRKYWAIGSQANHYDIQTVMTHEFGHWLTVNDLYHNGHQMDGCSAFRPAVMYYSRQAGTVKRDLHWIDEWGKWYIYTSGDVAMAPSITHIPPPLTEADSIIQTRLLPNYPNPFNPETWIPYELANDTDVTIEIYNSSGASIRKFDLGLQQQGRYVESSKALHWDGKNDNGETISSGVYFYTLRPDNLSETKQLIVSYESLHHQPSPAYQSPHGET